MKKYIKNIQKKLLKLRKTRSISRSDDPSFSSSGTSSDSSETQTVYKKPGSVTPTSVLRKNPNSEVEWMDSHVTNDFVDAFQMLDRDGDGKIGKEELRTLLSRIGGDQGVSEEEIKMMLTEIDRDGDGCISLEELSVIAAAVEGGEREGEGELREAFDFFDTDQDGNISAEELYSVFKTVVGDRGCTLEECRRMISGVDRTGEGFVCFEDFTRMMEHQLGG